MWISEFCSCQAFILLASVLPWNIATFYKLRKAKNDWFSKAETFGNM